jgi:hypothetical protein
VILRYSERRGMRLLWGHVRRTGAAPLRRHNLGGLERHVILPWPRARERMHDADMSVRARQKALAF